MVPAEQAIVSDTFCPITNEPVPAGALRVIEQSSHGGGDGLGEGLGLESAAPAPKARRPGSKRSDCNIGQVRPKRSAYQNSSRTRRASRWPRSCSALGRSSPNNSQARAQSPSGCSASDPELRLRQRSSQSDQTASVKFFLARRSWLTSSC